MATGCTSCITSEISRSLLTCAICKTEFRRPKALSCQHTYCAKCLKGCLAASTEKGKVKCAQCRKITVLPREGLDGLPDNHAVKGLLSMVRRHEKAAGKGKASSLKATAAATKKTTTGAVKKTTVGAKTTATKKVPPKGTASAAKPKSNKSVAKSAKTATRGVKGKNKMAAASKKVDSNANLTGTGKTIKSQGSNNKRVGQKPPSDESESDEFNSDEFTESDDSSGSDSDSDSSGSDSDGDSSGLDGDEDLSSYYEVSVGMEVYVFNSRGKQFPGRVVLMEACKIAGQRRIYAGVELDRENTALVTKDLDRIGECSLSSWYEDYERPCTVVRADDCAPASLIDQLMKE